MKPRFRSSWRAVCATLILVLSAAWVLSYAYEFAITYTDKSGHFTNLGIGNGAVIQQFGDFPVSNPQLMAGAGKVVRGLLQKPYDYELNKYSSEDSALFSGIRTVEFTVAFQNHPGYKSGYSWNRIHEFRVPFWILIVVVMLALAVTFIPRQKSIDSAHCAKCGYDLRASEHQCPECGTPFTPSTQTPIGPPRESGDKS